MNSHLYGTSSPSALGGREHRGQISEELIRQLSPSTLPTVVGGKRVFTDAAPGGGEICEEGGMESVDATFKSEFSGFEGRCVGGDDL
jgi:hypothetical protein